MHRSSARDAHLAAERAWGHSEPEPTGVSVGSWTWESRGDEVADIRYAGVPVLRSVRFVARDADWETVPVERVRLRRRGDGVRVRVRLTGFGAVVDLDLHVVAAGRRLTVRARARSRTSWRRNRVGIVVLHPPDLAGAALEVVHPDGSRETTVFPQHVSPDPPAVDIRGLAWARDGLRLTATFGGEVFEMEDQRNWTDASFKTFGTPLALPFPVDVARGEIVEQELVLDVAGQATPTTPAPVPIRFRGTGAPFPEIALAASTAPGAAPAPTTAVAAHLVEVDLDVDEWRAALDRALAEAATAGRPVDVRLITDEPTRIDGAVAALAGHEVRRLGAFTTRTHTTEADVWPALVAAVAAHGPAGAQLVGGVRSHFTELNRRHDRIPSEVPALTFPITPQVHADGRAQLVESIGIQRLVAEQAVALADGRPVHIGPVTLRPRYRAYAAAPPGPPLGGAGYTVSPDADDVRQMSGALAAWTIASTAALAVDGVASIAYFETWGPRGVRAPGGAPYPVAAALEALAAASGLERLVTEETPPPGVWIAAVRREGADTAYVANLTARPVDVPFAAAPVLTLDAFAWATVEIARARPAE